MDSHDKLQKLALSLIDTARASPGKEQAIEAFGPTAVVCDQEGMLTVDTGHGLTTSYKGNTPAASDLVAGSKSFWIASRASPTTTTPRSWRSMQFGTMTDTVRG